ncbi:MAG: Hsp20/alpha crystallin family protein [Lentisphaeria bacterium]|jgi:HSP20 family molecular chaperone IbpA|nr:Hsp20/alpha crystallin family protein [Lentisphaeria bacterium]
MNEKCTDKEKCEMKQSEEKKEMKCHETIEILPLVDIIEDEHAMTMYFEIPGAKPENVSVEVANHILSIEAHSCLCRKGRQIVFRRCFQLGTSTDISKIHAKTNDGVLTVILPKSEDAKVHKIPISE